MRRTCATALLVAAAVAVAGCGAEDFPNEPRPACDDRAERQDRRLEGDRRAQRGRRRPGDRDDLEPVRRRGRARLHRPERPEHERDPRGWRRLGDPGAGRGRLLDRARRQHDRRRQHHRRFERAPARRTICCSPRPRPSGLVGSSSAASATSESMRSSLTSTATTISSRPLRARSEEVLIPVSAERIACACFRTRPPPRSRPGPRRRRP